jgi:hypothetical protein
MLSYKHIAILFSLFFLSCFLEPKVVREEIGPCYTGQDEYESAFSFNPPQVIFLDRIPDTIIVDRAYASTWNFVYLVDTAFFSAGAPHLSIGGFIKEHTDTSRYWYGMGIGMEITVDYSSFLTGCAETLSVAITIADTVTDSLDMLDYAYYPDTGICRILFDQLRFVGDAFCSAETVDSIKFIVIREQ